MGGRKIQLVLWEILSLTSTGGVWLTGWKFLAESVINYGFPAAGGSLPLEWVRELSCLWAIKVQCGPSNQGPRTSSDESLPRAISEVFSLSHADAKWGGKSMRTTSWRKQILPNYWLLFQNLDRTVECSCHHKENNDLHGFASVENLILLLTADQLSILGESLE